MAKYGVLFYFALFTQVLGAANTSTGCEAEFVGRCTCGHKLYDGVLRSVTNCTNSGFTNVSVLEQLSPDTEVLIFTGNNISTLPPNLFGDVATYRNLEVIDLSNNNISRIQGKAFHRIPNVKKLILNNNRWSVEDHWRLFANMESLEELHLNAAMDIGAPPYIDPSEPLYEKSIHKLIKIFTENPLKNLTTIHLENNEIGPNLDMDIFCSLPVISHIYLANNSILQVSINSTCLHSLMHLDLSSNHIRRLSNYTLRNLEELPDITLDLSDNNFNCDCRMEDFYHWLHDTKVFVVGKENYKCEDGFPEDNAGELILSLPTQRLWCPTPLLLRPSFGIAHAILLIVVSLMVLLLTVVAIMNRRVVVFTVRRFGEPLYRRLQYSSIQKHEADREIEM